MSPTLLTYIFQVIISGFFTYILFRIFDKRFKYSLIFIFTAIFLLNYGFGILGNISVAMYLFAGTVLHFQNKSSKLARFMKYIGLPILICFLALNLLSIGTKLVLQKGNIHVFLKIVYSIFWLSLILMTFELRKDSLLRNLKEKVFSLKPRYFLIPPIIIIGGAFLLSLIGQDEILSIALVVIIILAIFIFSIECVLFIYLALVKRDSRFFVIKKKSPPGIVEFISVMLMLISFFSFVSIFFDFNSRSLFGILLLFTISLVFGLIGWLLRKGNKIAWWIVSISFAASLVKNFIAVILVSYAQLAVRITPFEAIAHYKKYGFRVLVAMIILILLNRNFILEYYAMGKENKYRNLFILGGYALLLFVIFNRIV